MVIIADSVGMVGVVVLLLGYFLLQTGKISALGISFSVFNLIGSLLILYSLFFAWNLSAVVIEAAWAVLSILGIVKILLHKQRSKGRA